MYKCVDQRGVTHYSDKPMPPSCKGGVAKIRATPPTGTGGPSVPAAAGTAADLKSRCARTAQEYTRMLSARRGQPDENRDERLEELREQARGCA
jgi:hypothetical protein